MAVNFFDLFKLCARHHNQILPYRNIDFPYRMDVVVLEQIIGAGNDARCRILYRKYRIIEFMTFKIIHDFHKVVVTDLFDVLTLKILQCGNFAECAVIPLKTCFSHSIPLVCAYNHNMTKSHLQLPKTAIFILGCIFFPLCITITLLVMDPLRYNFTGILNIPSLRPFAIIFALLYGTFIFLLLPQSNKASYLYLFFWIAGVLTPYAKGSLAGQFHLFFALTGFTFLQVAMVSLLVKKQTFAKLYFAMCFLASLLTMTFSSITGYTEIIYGAGLSILLTLAYMHKI